MHPVGILSLVAALLSFGIGIYVYQKDKHNISNRVFLIFAFYIGIYNLGEFLLLLSNTIDMALLAGRIVYTALWLTPAAAIHFAIVFPREILTRTYQRISKSMIVISYIAGFFVYLLLNLSLQPSNVITTDFGLTVIPTTPLPYVSWFIILFAIAFAILIHKYFFGNLFRIEKEQIAIFVFASGLVVIISLGTNLLPPLLDFQFFPLSIMSTLLVAVFIVIMAFPINQYRFLAISPELFAENIFNKMSDLVITLDKDKKIEDINNAVITLLGYNKNDLINTPFSHIIEKENSNEILSNGSNKSQEINFITKSKQKITLSILVTAIKDANDTIIGYVIVGRDLTETKRSLKEKEILIKEIHHRVKNNLQLISSLLDLQSEQLPNQQSREIFTDSQNRIRLMASFYEQMYQSKDIGDVNLKEYIENITTKLYHSYRKKGYDIHLKHDIDKISINLDMMLTCSFIISELVTNSIKHAFTDTKKGLITISLHKMNNHFTLIITDNGKGIPKNLDISKTKTLGLQLVNMFVQQLQGQIKLTREKGTTFTITFPNKK
jgi:PAS domain S-box-containing protein